MNKQILMIIIIIITIIIIIIIKLIWRRYQYYYYCIKYTKCMNLPKRVNTILSTPKL